MLVSNNLSVKIQNINSLQYAAINYNTGMQHSYVFKAGSTVQNTEKV